MDEEQGTPAPTEGGEPEKTEAQPTPTPTVTPDEIAALKARLEEKESFIGRQANELGELRKTTSYLQSLVEQVQQERAREPVEPSPAGTRKKINWDDPDSSIEQLVEEKLAAKESQRQKFEGELRAREAYSAAQDGFTRAVKENPRLYEGIEEKVRNAMQMSWQRGIFTQPWELRNPEAWHSAAALMRFQSKEFDKIAPPAPTPTRPTPTETPTGRPINTEEVSVEIDEETLRWGRGQGLTEKQISELVENEMKAAAQGLNKSFIRR